jgi:hypothetical protein
MSPAEFLRVYHLRAPHLMWLLGAGASAASGILTDAAAAAAEPPRMYVKRGGRHYAPVGSARLKAGEDVFVRQPSGRFECIGTTDGNAELPDLPITL